MKFAIVIFQDGTNILNTIKKQQLCSQKKKIELSEPEKNQGVVIIKAIKYCYDQAKEI